METKLVLLLALSGCISTEDPAQAAREAAAAAFQSECLADYQAALRYQQTEFPIRLRLHPDLDAGNVEAFSSAAEFWNRAMAAEVFTPIIATGTLDCGTASVVAFAANIPDGDLAHAWWGACRALVRTRPGVVLSAEEAAHELGHALNLQHEDDEYSVMGAPPITGASISPYSKCRVQHALDGTGL